MSPLVSIITVVYNGELHLQDTIDSIKNQTYKHLEYIVIDGNSTDKTVEIIKQNEASINHWISEPDHGIYDAMNKGVSKAQGDIIAILNADDIYYSDAIEKVVEHFNSTKTDIVFGNLTKLNSIAGEEFERIETPDYSRIETTMSIFHPSTFVRSSVYKELGMFNTKFKVSADYEFVLRCHLNGVNFSYLDYSTTKFRMTGVSNSNCDSYEEGYQILKMYDLSSQGEMAKLIYKCKRKKLVRNIAKAIPGSKTAIEKRQRKNWS